ncbi:MAG: biotin/lipoyl-binding protein, partial [Alphaproteobacteria bacterium]
AVDYESAGTVEFIVDKDRHFYFLEMNTRLQVEHPVTELVTGVDLVEQMIRIAYGEALTLKQKDVALSGWAVESRVYAEDPLRNFLPSTGRLVRYRPPREGSENGLTIRNDTGVYEGGEISIYYDPMIAKLITHGPDREAAIDHMARALDAFAIEGIQHNIPFLAAIMQHPRWRAGDLTTGFIDEEYPDGFTPPEPDAVARERLSIVAAVIDHMGNSRRRQIEGQIEGPPVEFAATRIVRMAGADRVLQVSQSGEGAFEVVFTDGEDGPSKPFKVESRWWFGEPVWEGRINGEPHAVQVKPVLNGMQLAWRGVQATAHVYTSREAELAALMPEKEPPDTSRMLLCPMPGLVIDIHVEEGQEVKAGDPLCVVEAMKMENILRAERDCTVSAILAKKGDSLA